MNDIDKKLTPTPGHVCTKCGVQKLASEFGKRSRARSGLRAECKLCRKEEHKLYYQGDVKFRRQIQNQQWKKHNPELSRAQVRRRSKTDSGRKAKVHRNALRRGRKDNRTPQWADLSAIKEFYQNCPEGYHVDHIIPLYGEFVSGFHILSNLQYLPTVLNLQKSNKIDLASISVYACCEVRNV